MNRSESDLGFDISMRWIIDLFLIMALVSLLSIPLALAQEAEVPFDGKDPAQPVVQATAISEPVKITPQAPETPPNANSVDFLMQESPLSREPASTTAPSVLTPKPAPGVAVDPVPAALSDPQGLAVEKTGEVAMLVSEQCSQNGGASEGTTSCERVYSNGHHATVLTQNANEGDELKRQTIIEEFDGNNSLLFKKTIRHRVDFNYLQDQKAKEKEFFDIIYQPVGRKTTRELMVCEYFLGTGKTRSLSWTQYQQIASEPKAGLVYHAVLRYGEDGNPDRGLAERWDAAGKAETLMNWNRLSKGYATLDQETWGLWESWIRNVSLQAYLP